MNSETTTGDDVGEDSAHEFQASMPDSYRQRYSEEEARMHAGIARRRHDALVHVELCEPDAVEHEACWICVVTDDCPGLLSLLSAAISAHSLDVLEARIHTRFRSGQPPEAVDLFAVRRVWNASGETIDASDVEAIRGSIEALLEGRTDVDWIARRATPTSPPIVVPESAVFQQRGNSDLLVVETPDRPGLLLTITLVLYREHVNVVRSNIVTIMGRARDEFDVLEIDGARLSLARKQAIIEKVLAALSARKRG